MRYISTRGRAPVLTFAEVTLTGLASDGGLYLPERWPRFSEREIEDLRGLPYPELAARVMQPFIGEALSFDALHSLAQEAYARFAHAAVTPLIQLDARHWLLELFHGPTLAFKDIALQVLGGLFDLLLAREDSFLTVIGATSGDTGSAAIDALAGRERAEIFMLHPEGRVTDVQRVQMTTVRAPNVHNIAVTGANFDECQAMVKQLFADEMLTSRHRLGAVNSINWARLMAQVVYYFAAGSQLGAPERRIAFAVPTGNFGDVFAGYVAARMGLPIARLVVATNVNDILHRALADGNYSADTVTPTAAPSMDIQVSSNFERLLFDLGGRDGDAVAAQMATFERTRAIRLSPDQIAGTKALFSSARADASDMAAAMRWAWDRCGLAIDPHTACALHAARMLEWEAGVPVVTLATAHPGKFRDAVERATGFRPGLPRRVGDLFAREERCTRLPNNYEAIRRHILDRAMPR
ncbi:threonine synthase [Qipengyuania sediminis]|uniref:threonine synthase n=1 Tax=Qipengyuania sediminis TaxID=1532023 RepID=UPI00105A5245|nr:threonine synthase [Qipengyuania sediminis]